MVSTEVLELLLTARYVGRPAFNSFSRDIEGIVSQSNALTRLGAAFSAAGDLAITAGLAVAGGLGAAAKQAVDFEQSMTRIQAVTGYTGPQMQGLQDQIMNLADQYGQNANDIAQSSYLVLSGVQALGGGYQDVMNNQILPALAAYVEASGAGQIGSVSWTDAIQKTLPVMVGMHQNFNQWANDLGILTMAEKSGLVTQQSLITGLTRFAPMAGLTNIPFDQAVALTGALASSGVIGARSGTELTTGIRTLLSGKGASLTQLEAFGLTPESFINSQTGGITDLPGIAAVLLPHLAGLDMTQRIAALNNLFGATGGRAFNQLLSQGQNGAPSSLAIYKSLLGAENPTGGAANAMFGQAAAIANGPQGVVNKLLSQLQTLAITIGEQVLPVLIRFAQWLTGELGKFQSFTKAHPQVVQDALKAVPSLIGGGIGLKLLGGTLSLLGSPGAKKGSTLIGDLLGGFGPAKNFIGPLEEGVSRRSGLLGWLQSLGSAGFNMGRGGWAEKVFPTAIANRQAALATGATRTGFVGDALKDLGTHAVAPFKAVGSGIAGLVKGIPSLISSIPSLIGMLPGLAGAFMTIVVPLALIAGAITIGVLAFTRYRTETMAVLGVIGKDLSPMFQKFAGIVKAAWGVIQKAWDAALPAIDKAMKAFLTALPKIVPLVELLGAVVGTVFAIIASVLVGLVNAFISALPDIIGFFSGIISFVGDFAQLIIDLFTNWKKIPQDIAALWRDVLNIFGNFFGMIGNLVSGFIQGIINFFQYLWDVLTGHSIIPDMIMDIVNWFLRLPLWVLQILVGLVGDVINLMGQFALMMVQAGLNLILGLIQGIINSVGAVIQAIGNVASGIWNGITSFFGINSPSTLMATAGMNIDQGLANGITGSAALPITAATNMANGVNTQFSSMTTNAYNTATAFQSAAQQGAAAMQATAQAARNYPNAVPATTYQYSPAIFTSSRVAPTLFPVGNVQNTYPSGTGQFQLTPTAPATSGTSATGKVYPTTQLPNPIQQTTQQIMRLSPQYTDAFTQFNDNMNLSISQISKDVVDKTGRMTVKVEQLYGSFRTNTELQLDKWQAETASKADSTAKSLVQPFVTAVSSAPTGILPPLNTLKAETARTADETAHGLIQPFVTAATTAPTVILPLTQGMQHRLEQQLRTHLDQMNQIARMGAGQVSNTETAAFAQIPFRIQASQLQLEQQVRKQMAQMNQDVTTATTTLANSAYQAGIGISQGMANGIYARKQAAMLAADDLASSVDTQFRGRLQIQSPSRVFFQHGADTVLGYIQGLLAHHADLNKTWDELGIPSTTSGNGSMNVGTLQVGSVSGLQTTQAATPGPTTYQQARAIQYERLNQRTNIQPISQYNLLQQLDLQYRYATQQTA